MPWQLLGYENVALYRCWEVRNCSRIGATKLKENGDFSLNRTQQASCGVPAVVPKCASTIVCWQIGRCDRCADHWLPFVAAVIFRDCQSPLPGGGSSGQSQSRSEE